MLDKLKARGLRLFFSRSVDIQAEDQVKFKSILGVKPGVYLAVLYGAIILLALFFILIYPGLSKPGSLGIFSSEPSGAALRIDGVTLGYTPCKVFLSQGKHTMEFVLPGFESNSREIEVPGRIFASAFLPRQLPLAAILLSPDPAAALAAEASEYIRWSSAGEPTEAWQIPLSLSEGVYRVGPFLKDGEGRKAMDEILTASLNYAVTKASVRDFVRAEFLADNGGLSPSPLTLLQTIQDAVRRIGNTPGAAFWLEELLNENAAAELTASAWYKKQGEAVHRINFTSVYSPGQTVSVLENIRFIPINSGNYERPGFISRAFLALEEISRVSWDAFTAENPQWGVENRDALIARGLVQEDYLRDPESAAYPYPAAPGISWYAAAAFCQWLTEKLPPAMREAGWTVRLPTEEEWESAARYFEDGQNNPPSRPAKLMGGLWEWCANPFTPLDIFSTYALERIDSAGAIPLERSVRGGSWINTPGSVDSGTRASLPPETSSPFVGFRPFIVYESDKEGTRLETGVP
jgi:hypothetical protein